MKVVAEKTIDEQILEEIKHVHKTGHGVHHIEVSKAELRLLRAEKSRNLSNGIPQTFGNYPIVVID
jgi:hypothetical protein